MISTDTDILATAEAWAKAGRGVALATVIETWGSAPRPVKRQQPSKNTRANRKQARPRKPGAST